MGKPEVHLAELGLQVRRKLPGFTVESYGYASFTELLTAATDIGVVRFGPKSEDRWFVFGGLTQPASMPVEDHEIVHTIWNACVDIDVSHRGWVDLSDCHVETDPDGVADEPERYVEMPRFDRTRQVKLLQSFAEDNEDPTRAALLAVASTWRSEHSPYRQLLGELQALGLRRAWFEYLRRAVSAELRAWASEHGLPIAKLFRPPTKPKAAAARTQATRDERRMFGLDEDQLRAFLKAAIDEMTLEELGQWPVPARLLLTKPG
ncbi:hypothetical protein DB30_01196 [Enhygromyxa salina]|uniref:HTH OST-type domain-containing protein n=1 Tax=Enhygromyxa salina TaxID=215803 RepID=A0A0C2CN22_9BACT|nr:hypothetical protein DB30_01196 [Enhygromyxa salina]